MNYNGVICTAEEPLVHAANRALCYGEGLIETMLWQQGKIRLFDAHAARLQRSLAMLHLPDISKDQLQEAIARTLAAQQYPERAVVRGQFFRGTEEEILHYMITARITDLDSGNWPGKGLRIGISNKVRKSADSIAQLKSTSRMPYLVAAAEAAENDWDDALLLNDYGRVAESTISNVFMVREGKVYTPALSEGCIDGILRDYLVCQGSIAGVDILEQGFGEEELLTADELFLTNALRGVQPVAVFKDKTYIHTISRVIFGAVSQL